MFFPMVLCCFPDLTNLDWFVRRVSVNVNSKNVISGKTVLQAALK